ncbi:MAG: FkbM family methyltransferase [Thermoflexales bacterium]
MPGEIKDALARALRPLFNFTYTARGGLVCGMRRRGGLGFLPGRRLTPEERWLAQRPWAGRVVYDVGAWEGVFTLFFARAVGATGQVIAFEPNPFNAMRLRENLALNGLTNARLVELALGERAGSAWLAAPAGASGRGALVLTPTDLPVAVQTLDGLVEASALPAPDFVKIDVEGAELAVLRGGADTLARRRPALLIEVHPQADYAALWAFLDALGYAMRCVETGQALSAPDAPLTEKSAWHLAAQARAA